MRGSLRVHPHLEGKGFGAVEPLRGEPKTLLKLTIHPRQFENIRYHLDRLGTNHASLFSDLDGTAAHCEWLHTHFPDEGLTSARPTQRLLPKDAKSTT